MRKNLVFVGMLLIGMLFLGASMIISSLILSESIIGNKELNGTLKGNLSGSFIMSESPNVKSDILLPFEAGDILGYQQQEDFIQDIKNGTLEGIPFTQVEGRYIFSKKALEEWVYSKTIN